MITDSVKVKFDKYNSMIGSVKPYFEGGCRLSGFKPRIGMTSCKC